MQQSSSRSLECFAMTTPVPVMALEYARPMTLGSIEARRAFRQMLFLSILSGLCVASCFLTFTETLIAAFIHTLVFTVTIALAVSSGKALFQVVSWADDPNRRARIVLDVIALAGVAGIGVAPLVYHADRY